MSETPKCALHAKDAAEAQRWVGKPCVVCGRTSEPFTMGAMVTVGSEIVIPQPAQDANG